MESHLITPLQGRTIRALLFDLGNTLWTYIQPANWEALEYETNLRISSILREQPELANRTEAELLALSQQLRTTMSQNIRAHLHKDREREPDFIEIVQETFVTSGWSPIASAQAFTLFQHTQIPIEGSRVLFDDVIATLTEFQRRGFLLGIVTNRIWGGPPFLANMDTLGLFKFFTPQTTAISADLHIRKPHPAIFHYTLQALDVPPEEAIMVGDSLRADVAGSNRLHMYAVWKPSPRDIAAIRTEPAYAQQPLSADRLLTYCREREQKRYNELYGEPQPDLIIENIQDLLSFLPKAGQL